MTIITSKICIVGDFAVGKTSTVERFVNAQFSEKYQTTIGIKVDTKTVNLDDLSHKLVIWDVAGTDKFGPLEYSYLRGSAGYVLVVDGTRASTLASVHTLDTQIVERYGDLPKVLLINKADLKENWELTQNDIEELERSFSHVFLTSAKTGNDVDTAITKLVSLISEMDAS